MHTVFIAGSPCLKRGKGPLVSVLLPEGTSNQLAEFIERLDYLTTDKSLIEYIVTIKDFTKINKFLRPTQYKVVVSQHETYESLARLANGDWLFPSHPAVTFADKGWDQLLLNIGIASTTWHGLANISMLVPKMCYDVQFIRRPVFKILNHLSLNPENEDWIGDTMASIDSLFSIPMTTAKLGNFSFPKRTKPSQDDAEKILEYIRSVIKKENRLPIWTDGSKIEPGFDCYIDQVPALTFKPDGYYWVYENELTKFISISP